MRFIFTAIATDVIQDMVEGKGNIKWRENEMKKERKRKKSSKKNPIAVRCLFTPFRARVPCHNLHRPPKTWSCFLYFGGWSVLRFLMVTLLYIFGQASFIS